MAKTHMSLDVYNHNRVKLCNLYDSSLNSPGQAHDIKMVVNINGTKTLSFDMPFVIEKERNFRWDFIKNEYLIRVEIGSQTDWFVMDKPEKKKDKSTIKKTVTCSHLSLILKTKNIYMTFDDSNGIGTIQQLIQRALQGSGWALGLSDTILESDGVTEKIRSYSTDGKAGAYQMIMDICKLFGAYPVFHGELNANGKPTVDIFSQNNKGALREMTIGKDLTAITVDFDSSSIITRLYVEGDYGEFGYVGIDNVPENTYHLTYLMNFDYYKEIGVFTDEHQAALDAFYASMPDIAEHIRATEALIQSSETELSQLWGMCSLAYWTVENGELGTRYTYGTLAGGVTTIEEGDVIVIVGKTEEHPAGEYRYVTVGQGGTFDLYDTDIAVIKYVIQASGLIGGKEVAIETKNALIETLQTKITGSSTITYSAKKKGEFAAQVAMYRDDIDVINEGTEAKDVTTLLRESAFASWVRTVQEFADSRDSLGLLLWLNNRDETLLAEFETLYPDIAEDLTILSGRQSAAEVLDGRTMSSITGRTSKESLADELSPIENCNVELIEQVGASPVAISDGGYPLSGTTYRDWYYIFPRFYRETNPLGLPCVFALNAIQQDGTVFPSQNLEAYATKLAGTTDPISMDLDTANDNYSLIIDYRLATDATIEAVYLEMQQYVAQLTEKVYQYYTGDLYSGSYWSWVHKDAVDTLSSLNVTDVELWYDDDTVVPAVPGLHELYGNACDLFMSLQTLYTQKAEYQEAQLSTEAEFQIAMGDLLRDGYWNDDTYTVGQEEYLYRDALSMIETMSKPKVKYTVSRVSLSDILGYSRDDLEINMQVRLYDADLGVNDIVYVQSVQLVLDDPSKDAVTISNEDIVLKEGSLSDLISRLTTLADLLDQRNSLYSRASAISSDGTFHTQKLEGAINVIRNQLSSTQSGWYTDANGNMIFEAADGQSAMMLCGAGLMIAYGKLDSGEWNWRTCSTGQGIVADTITAGTLSAERIEAGSITVDHLRSGEDGVGANIDLSQNGTLALAVSNGTNSIRQEMDAANAEIRTIVKQIENQVGSVTQSSSEVQQTAQAVTTTVSTMKTDLQNFQEQYSTYQRFDSTGLTIGKTENGQDVGMQLHLSNEKLSFMDNDVEVAYMSGQKLYITEARITDRLAIAVMRKGYFDWIATGDGLGLKWRSADVS